MCKSTSASRVEIANALNTEINELVDLDFGLRLSYKLNMKTLNMEMAQITTILKMPYQKSFLSFNFVYKDFNIFQFLLINF